MTCRFLFLVAWCLAFTTSAGHIETLDHHRYDGTVRLTDSSDFVVTLGTDQQHIPIDQLLRARLNEPLFEAGSPPKGWRIEEIGEARGVADETNGAISLRVTGGTARDAKHQTVYFLHRTLRGDGEVVARVQNLQGTTNCLAGVMLRDILDPYGAMSFLAVTPDHHLRFDWREGGWQPIQKQDEGIVQLPIWLKLVRDQREKEKDPFVRAYRSQDGRNWQILGQTKLAWRSEPFPEESENWQPRFYAGIAVTAPGTNTVSTARIDSAAVIAHGLLGEYFADGRFHTRRFARADRKIDFGWGFGSPGPGIDEDHFSIRWTGKLEPKSSENYRFYFDADNEARLWVNGEELPQVTFKKDRDYNGRELPLKAGEKYDIKLEFKEGAGAASVRLGWSSVSLKPQVIPAAQLSYEYDAAFPDDGERPASTNTIFAKGLWLRNGTYIAGRIASCDDSAAEVSWPGQTVPLIVPNTKISHIVFRNSRRGLPLHLAENHTGIIVKNGDFLEAEFLGLKRGFLAVNSLLFGRRSYSLENNDAIALVLNHYAPVPARYDVRLLNGSVLRAKSLHAQGEKLLVIDGALGEVPLPQSEVLEIVNTSIGP